MIGKYACDKLKIHLCELSPVITFCDYKINEIMWGTTSVYEYKCKYCGKSFKTTIPGGKHRIVRH